MGMYTNTIFSGMLTKRYLDDLHTFWTVGEWDSNPTHAFLL